MSLIAMAIRLLIASLIGAIFLRAACSLYNKLFVRPVPIANQNVPQPKPVPPKPPIRVPQSDSPYAPPMAPSAKEEKVFYSTREIDHPVFGQAMGICLVASLANILASVVVGVSLTMLDQVIQGTLLTIVARISLGCAGFLVLATTIKILLPTSFPRAFIVAGLFTAICLLVIFALGIVIGVSINFSRFF